MAGAVNIIRANQAPVGVNQDDIWIRQSDSTLWVFNGQQFVPINSNIGGAAGGDLSGTYPNPTVATVGTSTAANIHTAEVAANAATNANTASTIVKRDGSGNFTAGTITAALSGNVTGNVTGNLTGTVTGNASNVTGTVAIANGGTGATALANHGVVTAGASALTVVAPGTSGNVLTSNGTDWTSAAATTSGYKQLGKGTATTNQAITSTASPGTDITSLTVTCTPDGTHDVKITVAMPSTSTSTAVRTFLALQKDGVIINVWTTANQDIMWNGTYIDPAPTNASHTYKLSAWVASAATFNTVDQFVVPSVVQNLILVEQTA